MQKIGMSLLFRLLLLLGVSSSFCAGAEYQNGLPLYYYKFSHFVNFGDYLCLKIVERMVGGAVTECESWITKERKLVALGSILIFARKNDVVWGTGMNAKRLDTSLYKPTKLDIRALRGPLTRAFLVDNFHLNPPEVYGDPALLLPYLFPEFEKPAEPEHEYLIIPHYSNILQYPKTLFPNVAYPSDPWREVIRKILNSKFVISGSLHGIVVAEAYGIPARYLRIGDEEPLFKYMDYYAGTKRTSFQYATSVEEALQLGGEPPHECDVEKLFNSFPFEFWPDANRPMPQFPKKDLLPIE